ncbi:MAG: HrcA family transcriptional regulator [Actinomycetota bacterium]
MTATETLDERKAAVLRGVVTDHIRTGEPVGSGALAAHLRLGVSAATIRNDMAALEGLGYLTHPHTSAGRIPTDLGYRYYVDTLPRWPRLPERQERVIATYFSRLPAEPDEAVRGTTVLLSRVTHYGAVAYPPSSPHVIIGGAANIVSEEAFERRETVGELLRVLEEENEVLDLLNRMARTAEGVAIQIGSENPLTEMREASLVVAPYRSTGRGPGIIAVVGPTRMAYPTAISAVLAVARGLSGSTGISA